LLVETAAPSQPPQPPEPSVGRDRAPDWIVGIDDDASREGRDPVAALGADFTTRDCCDRTPRHPEGTIAVGTRTCCHGSQGTAWNACAGCASVLGESSVYYAWTSVTVIPFAAIVAFVVVGCGAIVGLFYLYEHWLNNRR
jgi:hypothetical protein